MPDPVIEKIAELMDEWEAACPEDRYRAWRRYWFGT
jgi:hypothetical protein